MLPSPSFIPMRMSHIGTYIESSSSFGVLPRLHNSFHSRESSITKTSTLLITVVTFAASALCVPIRDSSCQGQLRVHSTNKDSVHDLAKFESASRIAIDLSIAPWSSDICLRACWPEEPQCPPDWVSMASTVKVFSSSLTYFVSSPSRWV